MCETTEYMDLSSAQMAFSFWKEGLVPSPVMCAIIDKIIEQGTGVKSAQIRRDLQEHLTIEKLEKELKATQERVRKLSAE